MLTLDFDLDVLDKNVLKWYNSSSTSDISNALYHGYRIVSDDTFNTRIDTTDVNKITTLETEIKEYKARLSTIRSEVKNELIEMNKEILQEKNMRLHEYKERVDELLGTKNLLNDKCLQLETKFSELENIMTNSYKKGVYAENKLEDILTDKLGSDFFIDNVGKRDSHSTDIHVKNEKDDGIVLIESKFYSDVSKHMINHKEIPKFHNDIDTCKSQHDVYCAIFISYSCDIPTVTNSFTVRNEKGMRVYYFANMTDDLLDMMVNIINMETICYKEKQIRNNDDMNRFLTIYFKELMVNYNNIEVLDPGYDEIIKKIMATEKKFRKKKQHILDNIKVVSDNFVKLRDMENRSTLSIGINDLLSIKTPHYLNMGQWDTIVNELVRLRVSNTKLSNDENVDENVDENLDVEVLGE